LPRTTSSVGVISASVVLGPHPLFGMDKKILGFYLFGGVFTTAVVIGDIAFAVNFFYIQVM
jgi:hypothetical protein